MIKNKTSIYVTECPSTNDFLNKIIKKKQLTEWSSVLTDYQTNGRGQRNNSWVSKKNKNLLYSLLLLPDLSINNQFDIHVIISLSIYNTLNNFGLKNIQIKWPNDIYVNKSKIAGILVENIIYNKKIKKCIIGIGMNINQKKFFNLNATSIINEIGKEVKISLLLDNLINNIRKEYNSMKSQNYYKFDDYIKLLYGYKKELKFYFEEKIIEGKIIDVKKDGKIVISINNSNRIFDYGAISYI